jgi:molybdenum cofactor cytidylyltransferase
MAFCRDVVIIPAAGLSSRMSVFKPLLQIDGLTMIERLAGLYADKPVDTVVVVGWNKEKIIPLLEGKKIEIVDNPDYIQGMFSSLRAGLKALAGRGYRNVLIHPADIPLVRTSTVQRVLIYGEQNPDKIVLPVFRQQRGHPCLIPEGFCSDLAGWQGEGGLRAAIEQIGFDSVELPVADRFINLDLDTPQDFARLQAEYESYAIPSEDECKSLLQDIYQLPERVFKHCEAVAGLAALMVRLLRKNDCAVKADLVTAAAWLHDLAKGQPKHDKQAEAILCELGFTATAEIAGRHKEIGDLRTASLENKIVYLSDKLVLENRIVGLEARFGLTRSRNAGSAEVKTLIDQRYRAAVEIQAEINRLSGGELDQLLQYSIESQSGVTTREQTPD